MKISVIGATGKVGRAMALSLVLSEGMMPLDVSLYARNTQRVKGLEMELQSVPARNPNLNFATAEGVEETLEGADMVVMMAASWPTEEEQAHFAKMDPSGRLAQVGPNVATVRALAEDMKEHAPNAKMLMVTNQSDILSEIARGTLDPESVIGFGGLLDTLRLRHVMRAEYNGSEAFPDEDAMMVGYHNGMMRPLYSTLSQRLQEKDHLLQSVWDKARIRGKMISDYNTNTDYPEINSGASIDSGYAVAQTVLAFSGNNEGIEAPYNIALDKRTAEQYGVRKDIGLSVPVRITHGSIGSTATRYAVNDEEQSHFANAQDDIRDTLGQLKL